MTKKALKLPDGGTLDLPIPEGFGSTVVAMNDATLSEGTKRRLLFWGIAAGVIGIAMSGIGIVLRWKAK